MLITQERILEILKEAGVLLEGHFLLTSGRHSNKYLQCAKVFRNTKYSEELCSALAEQFRNDGVEVVIGPAMGAVQMAYEVSRGLHCENFFAERDQDGKVIRKQLEVDFVCNLGSSRYYIQSAYSLPDEAKRTQEIRPFRKIDDSFKKIVITKDIVQPYYDDYGILTVNIYDFLLDPQILEK